MITVGATAGGYVKGTEATAFSKWNTGLIDRFKEELVPPDGTTAIPNKDEAAQIYKENFLYPKQFSNRFGLTSFGENKKFSDNIIEKNLSIVTEYYKWLIAYSTPGDQPSGGTVGFIPFKLGLTLDGISGIKIYNVLRVNTEFLPKAYGKSVDLIVTGVSHRLNNNDWETSVEATVMPKTGAASTVAITAEEAKETLNEATSHGRRKVNTYSTLMVNPKTNSKPIIVPDVATKQKYLSLYSTQLGAGFNNFVIRAGNSNPDSKVVKWVKWNNSQTTQTLTIKSGKDKEGGTIGGQLGNGADISSALYNALQKLQKELLKPKYSSVIPVLITAGNDSFHQGKTINSSSSYNISYKTTHTRGLAIDLRSSTVDKDNLVIDALEVAGFGGILWHNPPHIHANVDSN
jgi:hypothetical protein